MEIRTEVEIAASASEVWRTLLDFPRYADWNPFIVAIDGEPKVGARLEVTLSLPDSNREQTFRPRILKCDEAEELRWLGHLWMKGLLDGEHFFRLEARGPEKTRVLHGEDFSGLLLKPLLSRLTDATRGFIYMNQALKRRVESKTSAR
jgi:hypothetical protein